ncbi:M24 family metallopeptidase [Plastorhodobacter daqingensis]|uniref:M24 family metallopeptidase n=1 Tax=Plastorhodobacter daqingensis TaxID=1387281 RepID=A0ABW2UM48_9RHOB
MTQPSASDRLSRLQAQMSRTGTDLLALAPGAHMRWLLGFAPHPDERLCLLLIGRDAAGFVMPALNANEARQHSDLPFAEWEDAEGPGQALAAMIARICPAPGQLALDETMRADHALLILDALPNAARRLAAADVGALRRIKDASEIAALAENARIADAAQDAVRAALRPGVTEREMVQVARDAFAKAGAQCEFAIVAFGPNSAFPHHHPGPRALTEGDVVLVDIGGRRGGHVSDITRMAALGHAPEGYAEVHAVVEAAVLAALAAVRPGVPVHAVDDAARGVITDAGYGAFFTHRVGHGLGTEVHEPPYVTATNREPLREGMVFTIEPGIYLPGRFGIRLEEVAVVTAAGAQILSARSRDLHIV